MSIDVNKITAKAVLLKAMEVAELIDDNVGKAITEVLRGTHKTYKYVLFTALLAKATNEDVDALSLQAGDNSKGAYDARSLCHGVVVPFEREYIPHSLGDSNEPYLNKPARFLRISMDNAVRAGKDAITLSSLIDIISQINTKEEAEKYLSSAIAVLKEINAEYDAQFSVELATSESDSEVQNILDFINRASENACEGEMSPLIVATLESICFPSRMVVAHKVNECGASSKEVGDIDIFVKEDGRLVLLSAIEVKDKDFTEADVQHAISKFHKAGIERSLFIYGKKTSFTASPVYQIAARYGRIGAFCSIVSIMDYARLRLNDARNDLDFKLFITTLFEFAKSINVKSETLDWVKKCIENK